ncbi:CGNR zinc finger domain-containing protein [Propionispora hippei]|uniref:CGNR zinc finger domain-containing protein n=1 Tax=Propionispora hippei DSM 15287 TaxID=1123003 RepID=A0A1M6GNP3_9FIRM|nr:CGNR zinc finger domain-containing protein [Propionispora hippei]SHJ11577.1 CGNR zinc finger domain-containing protein [Propionispora hippei DSM 15287]
MLSNTEFLTMSGNLFTFTNYKSDCRIDINHTDDGRPLKRLRIKSDPSKPIRFAYTPQRGMVRINSAGSVTNDAVLDELLSLPDGNLDRLINYFEKYGFIIPISSTMYESYKSDDLFTIIRRMQYTIKLMTKIQEPQKDYMAILYLVCYLLFTEPVTITSLNNASYDTCPHKMWQYIKNTDLSSDNDLPIYPSKEVDATDQYFLIPDGIKGNDYKLYFTEYYPGFNDTDPFGNPLHSNDIAFHEIRHLFKNALGLPPRERQVVEFFFHFQSDISPICNIGPCGLLKFSKSDVTERYKKFFDASMKTALIDIAKTTLKTEIDHAISAITPDYDTDRMSASWYIPDYIAGLYFSLFYMDSNMVIYRQCGNPTCGGFFRISTTNSKKRYCDDSCRNAASQRRHRQKKQSQQ